jgi:gamma-glutamyltranspeptidase/glutathione hydrolase
VSSSARAVRRAALAALFVFCAFAQGREAPVAKHFIVAAAHPLAVDAGYEMLARGGSALDAAIAVQLVLGLVEPESSGIGGGAFLLYWSQDEKTLRTYDGRETAPAAARAERFLDASGKPVPFVEAAVGGRSVGVPGVLRMLEIAHRRHGKLPWSEVFAPAITAAEKGFTMSPRLHAVLERERYLNTEVYYDRTGKPRSVGAKVVNPAYANTLRTIAREGADAFYSGPIAADIVRAVRANAKPGDLSEADLAGYRALERDPLCGTYRVYRLCTMGPPSAGGIAVLQMLALLERTPFERAPPQSATAVHYFSEASRLAFADRARYAADSDFVPVPIAKLLSSRYLDARARLIGQRSMRIASPDDTESPGTSHFSIVDREGNAVAMTTTIEATFGSRVMVRGFILNNELTDFDFLPRGANRIEPGKRPRSSMAPTMVFAPDGSLKMALGSPGGPMIINYVAKALVGTLAWGIDLQSAIALPNFGSRNGPTYLEQGSAFENLKPALVARGHEVEIVPLVSGLHGIERVPGGWRGGADPRREGVAKGD